MIAIIDYGSGNVGAIANIYKQLKIPHQITGDLRDLEAAERYILPGVGAFDATMSYLNKSGMVEMLNEQVMMRRKKVLGVCVGMQILADSSEEGVLPGLGWIHGRVRKIDAASLPVPPRLPHMGWNSVTPRPDARLFEGVDVARGFYFLHSYYFDAATAQDVAATVAYGQELTCAVARGNVFGMQFHPEKSHANGVAIFRNFAGL
jgi:imidazole glycerol-phosphate synthase subunit HisH